MPLLSIRGARMAEGTKDPSQLTDAEVLAELEEFDRRQRDEAAAKAWDVPSAFINQYHVNLKGDLTRITFGEATTPGGVPVIWRTSITLTTEQALQLAEFIWSQYDLDQQRLAAMRARADRAALINTPDQSKNG